MSQISFLIPGAKYNGETLALSVDPINPGTGRVVVVLQDPTSKYQLWDAVSWENGYVFINLATDMILTAQGGDSPVIAAPRNQVGNHSIWTPSSREPFMALRPQYDSDQNLNIRGDGPYHPGTQVLTYTWSGGDPNEVWEIVSVSSHVAIAEPELVGASR